MSEPKTFKIKLVATNGGWSVAGSGVVNLTVKVEYSELANVIQLQQLLNCDCHIKAKLIGGKPFKLGMFKIANTTIDGDGQSKVKFTGIADYIETNMLSDLPTNHEDEPRFHILVETEIEEENEEE